MPKAGNYTISARNVLTFTILLIIAFQDGITRFIPKWSSFDELFTLVLLFIDLLTRVYRRDWKVNKFDLITGLCIIGYYLSTWVGTVLGRYQSSVVSLAASFLGIKWFIVFWSCKNLYKVYTRYNTQLVDRHVVYETVLAFGIIENYYWMSNIHNVFNPKCYQNILAPISLCAVSVALIAIVLSDWRNNRWDYICLVLLLENLLFSTKAKGYAAILITVFLLYWIIHKNRKVRLWQLLVLAIACIVLVWDKFYLYFIYAAAPDHDYARYRLMATGAQIMRDCFPFGTGWGTWGSYYAAKYYSPVYYLYGLSTHHELGIEAQRFMQDSYLAVLFGESGSAGTICIFAFMIVIFTTCQKMRHRNKYLYAAGLLSIAYILITFLEETGFMNPALLLIAVEMGVVFSRYELSQACSEK